MKSWSEATVWEEIKKSTEEAITFELGLSDKGRSVLNKWRSGRETYYRRRNAEIAKAIFNHYFTGMRSYLFHHSALNKWTNIFMAQTNLLCDSFAIWAASVKSNLN